MELSFSSKKLQKTCADGKKLTRTYGPIQARIITKHLLSLQAAQSLLDIKQLPQMRLHPLSARRKGTFAIDIKQPYRLIIRPLNGDLADLQTITKIQIVEIIDYH